MIPRVYEGLVLRIGQSWDVCSILIGFMLGTMNGFSVLEYSGIKSITGSSGILKRPYTYMYM
jgi:hypothetical protein